MKISYDVTDLVFRLLFSSIFLALGVEHLISDELIREMMPDWIVAKRLFSLIAGVILISGGGAILFGIAVKAGAGMLAVFLLAVTLLIHAPALLWLPPDLPEDWRWLWQVYQRSNLVKNLCLLGACFHLLNHRLGRFRLGTSASRPPAPEVE